MSSNISIQKFCEFCGKSFIAKTLFTRYCSKKCNARHYKQAARDDKARILGAQLLTTETSPASVIANAAQDYFEVSEAAELMRISKRTLYRLLASKKLKKKKVLSRTVILKEDVKMFFAIQ